MLGAGGNEVDAGGLDGRMTENVGELGDVSGGFVIHAGKQMSQVVWKDFVGGDVRESGAGFHLGPDLLTRQGTTVSG